MKRPNRIPALLLALVLALGLTPPALAAGTEPSAEEARTHFKLENSYYVWDEDFTADLYSYTPAYEETADDAGHYLGYTVNGIMRIDPQTEFYLANTASAGTNCVVYAKMNTYEWTKDMWSMWDDPYTFDAYAVTNGMWPQHLNLDAGGFLQDTHVEYDVYSNYTELRPGESCVFALNTSTEEQTIVPLSEGMIAQVFVYVEYPDLEYARWFWWYYLIDSSVPSGVEPPNDLDFKVSQSRMLDNGVGYNYTITNNTDEQMTGSYALLSYQPKKGLDGDGKEYFHAQVHTFDVDLAPGKSMSSELSSYFYDLSAAKNIWITFDSEAERDSFLASPALSYWASYYVVNSEQWLKDNFNITLRPAK